MPFSPATVTVTMSLQNSTDNVHYYDITVPVTCEVIRGSGGCYGGSDYISIIAEIPAF